MLNLVCSCGWTVAAEADDPKGITLGILKDIHEKNVCRSQGNYRIGMNGSRAEALTPDTKRAVRTPAFEAELLELLF
jgi:hypothetical protein